MKAQTVWFLRKVAQFWPGCGEGARASRIYRWTVRFATRMPSFKSSPRMRSAPQRRFSIAMRRMGAMTSGAMRGSRKPSERDLFRRGTRNPARCQRRTVSGLTRSRARLHRGRSLASRTADRARGRERRGVWDGARRDDELLAQKRVFGNQLGAKRSNRRRGHPRRPRAGLRSAKRPHHSFCKLEPSLRQASRRCGAPRSQSASSTVRLGRQARVRACHRPLLRALLGESTTDAGRESTHCRDNWPPFENRLSSQ